MSMWALISWFTPTSVFLFLNLMIGTIVLTSRFRIHKNPEQEEHLDPYSSPPPLVRSSSLLDRVRSINFSHHYFQHPNPEPLETEHVAPPHVNPDIPTGLTRTPSLLERVRSINFSNYQFQHPNAEPLEAEQVAPHHADSDIPTAPTGLTRRPSLLDRLKSMDFSFYKSEQPDRESEILDSSGSQYVAARDTSPRCENLVHRSKSDRGSGAPVHEHEKMKKSASEKFPFGGESKGDDAVEERRPKTARVEKTMSFRGDEEVDAKADDFINRFKQHLKLQRLDSLLRYKEMLKRN